MDKYDSSADVLSLCEASASSRTFAIPEILAQIVGHTIERPGNGDPMAECFGMDQLLTKLDSPWSFLLVCSHWRDVILTTPELWSTIILYHVEDVHLDKAFQLSMVDAYLKRSRNAPLTISIGMFSDIAFFEALLGRLLAVQHRWLDVRLTFHPNADLTLMRPPDIMRSFSSQSRFLRLRNMKSLVNLQLDFSVTMHWPVSQRVGFEAGHCPTLKILELRRGLFFCETDEGQISPQSLSIMPDVDNNWHILLQYAQNVEHLRIFRLGSALLDHPFNSAISRGRSPPINLPNVRTMEVVWISVPNMLQWIKLLKSVKLKMTYNMSDFNGENLPSSIKNSGISLESLTIWCGRGNVVLETQPHLKETLRGFLFTCDELRTLCLELGVGSQYLSLPAMNSVLLQALDSLSNVSTPFLPRLNTFGINFYARTDEEGTTFKAAIRDLILAFRGHRSPVHFNLGLRFERVESESEADRIARYDGWINWKEKIEETMRTDDCSSMNDGFEISFAISYTTWFIEELDQEELDQEELDQEVPV